MGISNERIITEYPVSRWSGCQKYLAETPTGVYQNRPTGTDDGRAERSENLTQKKKDLIRDVSKLFDILPENKQERAIGIMQGMALALENPVTKDKQTNNAHE